MSAVKIPCLQCKEKHVKCDEQRPACGRCQKKRLSCTRPSKKTVFRHESTASFSKDQQWVSSRPAQFEFDDQSAARDTVTDAQPSRVSGPAIDGTASPSTTADAVACRKTDHPDLDSHPELYPDTHGESHSHAASHSLSPSSFWPPLPAISPQLPPPPPQPPQPPLERSHDASDLPPLWDRATPVSWPASSATPGPPASDATPGPQYRRFPLQDVQEACLMKYYIDVIGHWFDLADEDRHFQLVVPVRARQHPHLLNAIFAVAARHLCRMPQYKTPRGIVYMGQLLPDLDAHSAVEYTLECIPALRRFHDAQDDDYRDSIIATAVILRQLEEIDDEDPGQGHHHQHHPMQINFLPIIDSVLRSPPSQTLFGRRSLIRAAYWMALRQEIYHSFTRRQAPQMILAADYWPTATNANKAVMHTVQVVKWRWGDGSEHEWNRLMRQQEHVEQHVLADFQPIFHRQADKSKGEIFPTVWYGSNIEVTSIQQSIMARSVLVSENPTLKSPSATRSTLREAESQVRSLMLELCGIALCHPSSPPAILNAAFVIQMYGDFFTDRYERQALRSVVDKYRATHAWPARKLTEMFC